MMNPIELAEEIGEGFLYINGDGQGLEAIKNDLVICANRPLPYKKSGFDTAHVIRYAGTDLLQWYGRRRDGRFHPWGKIMRLTKAGKELTRNKPESPSHQSLTVWTAQKRYMIRCREVDGQDEWFVDDNDLPSGEWAAGPFQHALDAEMALAQLLADAVGCEERH